MQFVCVATQYKYGGYCLQGEFVSFSAILQFGKNLRFLVVKNFLMSVWQFEATYGASVTGTARTPVIAGLLSIFDGCTNVS